MGVINEAISFIILKDLTYKQKKNKTSHYAGLVLSLKLTFGLWDHLSRIYLQEQ